MIRIRLREWFTASLKYDWNALTGMPDDWLPKAQNFRVDDATFMRIEREMCEEEKEERKVVINNL